MVNALDLQLRSCRFIPGHSLSQKNSGQIVHIQYNLVLAKWHWCCLSKVTVDQVESDGSLVLWSRLYHLLLMPRDIYVAFVHGIKIDNNLHNCKQTYLYSLIVNVLLFKNPSKPHFNHFLFESICIVISTACKLNPAAISTFEDGLFPPFQTILQQDVQGL